MCGDFLLVTQPPCLNGRYARKEMQWQHEEQKLVEKLCFSCGALLTVVADLLNWDQTILGGSSRIEQTSAA